METTQEFLRNAKIVLQNKNDRRFYTLPFALLNLEEVVKITTSKSVANQAARLALSEDQAVGFAIVDADTGKTWMLVAGGNPATSSDWLQIGDRDIQISDVSGLQTALDGKLANTNAAVAAAIAEDPAASRAAMSAPLRSYVAIEGEGVDATGTADSTTAIHALIATAQAAGGPGAVYFPPGTYKCNLAITGNLAIFGAGNGHVGDWTGADGAPRTMLVPASDASPVISVAYLRGVTLAHFEIRGNGAGTTGDGIQIDNPLGGFSGNGLICRDVNIRRCTRNFHSAGGCNVTFEYCGIFQGNYGVYLPDDSFAHTYLFRQCSIGGAPASGSGRCFHIENESIVQIENCEQGNCTDYLYVGTKPATVSIQNGNWETYSATVLGEMRGGQLVWNGGRLSTTGKTLVRVYSGATFNGIAMRGLNLIGAHRVIEHNGIWPYQYSVQNCGANATIAEYNADFSVLTAEAASYKLIAGARSTANQALTGSATDVVAFAAADINRGSKFSTSTYRFTPGRRGYYRVSATVRLATVTADNKLMVYVNGSTRSTLAGNTTGGAGTTLSGSDVIYLDADDYAEIRLQHAADTTIQSFDNYTTKCAFEELPWD